MQQHDETLIPFDLDFQLQWSNEGYWNVTSRALNIENEIINLKQNQLTEVLLECLKDNLINTFH